MTTPTLSILEKNSRKLIGVLCEFYPGGVGCEELRRKFEKIAHRGHATYYQVLRFCKDKRWIISDGRTYRLNPDNSWRTPLAREDVGVPPVWGPQFQHVLEMRAQRIDNLERANKRLTSSRKAIAAGEVAGPAIAALVTIMSDSTISIRKRVQAAEQLIAFKSPQDVSDSAKQFLALIFTDPDQNIDDRLTATTALRRSEDVRIVPAIERPLARADDSAGAAVEPIVPLKELVEMRRARQDALQGQPIEVSDSGAVRVLPRPGSNGSGDDSDHS
jgi:hypothetical protein